MKIIGITGSISSGKTTVANLLASKKYPLFSADLVVSNLYKKKNFNKVLIEKFKLKSKKKINDKIKLILKKNKNDLYKLETIIHPFVREKMIKFLKKKNKLLFLEVPLLIESKLNKYFDNLIYVGASKKLRLKRYLQKKNKKETFILLDKRQLSASYKKKFCDHIINNNYSLEVLRKNVKKLMERYE